MRLADGRVRPVYGRAGPRRVGPGRVRFGRIFRRSDPVLPIAVVLAVVASACIPSAVTPQGRGIAGLYNGFMITAAVVALIVLVPATFAIARFRRRTGNTDLPVQRKGHLVLELAWTVIPALTVVGLFIATFLVLTRVDATDAPATTEIEVTAYRWGWSFTYPNDGITVEGLAEPGPEVAVPVGEPITLRMTSADVIHSFYVPLFLFKRDVNPGRENVFQFSVDEPGSYAGQCAEFCGLYHARMPFRVLAMDRAGYDAWVATMQAAARSSRQPSDGGGAPTGAPSDTVPGIPQDPGTTTEASGAPAP